MKEVTLKVQEDKYRFFMELMAQLDFVQVEEDFEVPEFHKSIVRERLATYKNEEQYKWEDIKDKFDLE